MLKTVMSSEAYLFSHEEIGCLRNYDNLTCMFVPLLIIRHRPNTVLPDKGRYLLIRLCLRKTDKWHRLDSLKYQGELGDDILDAVHELCSDSDASSLKPYDHVKVEEKEIIDFTFDERSQQPVPGPSNSQEPNCESAIRTEPDYSVFAEDDSHASLCELLECLLMDELKTIAKQMKLKLATKVGAYENNLNLTHDGCIGLEGCSSGHNTFFIVHSVYARLSCHFVVQRRRQGEGKS